MTKDTQRTYEEVKQAARQANEQARANIGKTQQTLRENETIDESIRRDRRESKKGQ